MIAGYWSEIWTHSLIGILLNLCMRALPFFSVSGESPLDSCLDSLIDGKVQIRLKTGVEPVFKNI